MDGGEGGFSPVALRVLRAEQPGGNCASCPPAVPRRLDAERAPRERSTPAAPPPPSARRPPAAARAPAVLARHLSPARRAVRLTSLRRGPPTVAQPLDREARRERERLAPVPEAGAPRAALGAPPGEDFLQVARDGVARVTWRLRGRGSARATFGPSPAATRAEGGAPRARCARSGGPCRPAPASGRPSTR